MLQLLSPFALLALLGILVPIAIHLWNRKPGRTVKVGSVRWLESAASKRLSSLRLTDIWLLLLRVVIVGLVALLLARPQWLDQSQPKVIRQVLVSPEHWTSVRRAPVRGLIDSLRKAGYQLHWLTKGFPPVSNDAWTDTSTAAPVREGSENYWALLETLNQQPLPPHDAWVFAPSEYSHFSGLTPEVSFPVTWIPLPPRGEKRWLHEAFLTCTDSLALVVGIARATGTQFVHHRVALPGQSIVLRPVGLPEVAFIKEGNKAFVEWRDAHPYRVLVQQTPWRVRAYYEASRAEDVRYLAAALGAYAEFTSRRLDWSASRQVPGPSVGIDWLLWLSDQPVPTSLRAQVRKGMYLLEDAKSSVAQAAKGYFSVSGAHQPVTLHRRTAAMPGSLPVWKDNLGQPVLSTQRDGKGTHYQFYSRFNPTWSALPESADFPRVLGQLLYPPSPALEPYDLRTVDESQLQPRRLPPTTRQSGPATHATDLRVALGWLVLLLWGAERTLAQFRRKIVIYSREEAVYSE